MRIQKRTLFIGIIVWLLFFGWWFRGFLFRNWQFRLFSLSSWKHLIHEFRSGWHISSKSDWIFIFSFVLAPFVFAFLWWLIQKIRWRKIFKKIWNALRWPFLAKKKKKLKEATAAYEPKQKPEPYVYRPQPLPITNNRPQTPAAQPQRTFLNSSTAMGDFPPAKEPISDFNTFDTGKIPQFTPPSAKPEPFTNEAFAEMANTPLSEVEIPQMEPANENIDTLLEKAGYTLLSPVPVGNKLADFVAVSAGQLLIGLYDTEAGDWLADEESFNDEDPLWFSETDHRVSPVFELKQTADALQNKLGDLLHIQPVLIEKEGTIINAEDMMKTWNDMGVIVCRTGMGGPVELPTGTEVLKDPQEKISDEVLEKIKAIL